MPRITLDIDDEALAQAMRYAEGRTKTEVINAALRAFARRRRLRELIKTVTIALRRDPGLVETYCRIDAQGGQYRAAVCGMRHQNRFFG